MCTARPIHWHKPSPSLTNMSSRGRWDLAAIRRSRTWTSLSRPQRSNRRGAPLCLPSRRRNSCLLWRTSPSEPPMPASGPDLPAQLKLLSRKMDPKALLTRSTKDNRLAFCERYRNWQEATDLRRDPRFTKKTVKHHPKLMAKGASAGRG
jgi:hypothetical protein